MRRSSSPWLEAEISASVDERELSKEAARVGDHGAPKFAIDASETRR
jgi:hypothetical protein